MPDAPAIEALPPRVVAAFSGILCIDAVYQDRWAFFLAIVLAVDRTAPDGDRLIGDQHILALLQLAADLYACLASPAQQEKQGTIASWLAARADAGVDDDADDGKHAAWQSLPAEGNRGQREPSLSHTCLTRAATEGDSGRYARTCFDARPPHAGVVSTRGGIP